MFIGTPFGILSIGDIQGGSKTCLIVPGFDYRVNGALRTHVQVFSLDGVTSLNHHVYSQLVD